MVYTMEDFNRQYIQDHFVKLTPAEQRNALERLSPEHRRELFQALVPEDLSEDELRQLLDQFVARRTAQARKAKRKR